MGFSTISAFVENQGAVAAGFREPNYYPVNIKRILENDNLFSSAYLNTDEGAKELLQLEKEHLFLVESQLSFLNDRDKEFSFERDRVCIQPGKMLSNLLYYRSENGACYGGGGGSCAAYFAEFPIFKTCSSISDLRSTFNIPTSWSEYSLNCNFNENFATLPSFVEDVNFGYSYCLAKDLNENNNDNTIIFGHMVGNSHIERSIDSIKPTIANIFGSGNIQSSQVVQSGISKTVKLANQRAINLGTQAQNLQGTFQSRFAENYSLIVPPLPGTVHTGSYQDKVSSNYLLIEDIREHTASFTKYKVVLNDNSEYFVYLDTYTSWYLIANYDLSSSEFNTLFNNYQKTSTLPARTPERLYLEKREGGKTYTLTEESELLAYNSVNFFNPNQQSYTKLPVYYLRITNSNPNDCADLFGRYNPANSFDLAFGKAIACRYDESDNSLYVTISEKFFSNEFSKRSQNGLGAPELGAGYILLRNVLFP